MGYIVTGLIMTLMCCSILGSFKLFVSKKNQEKIVTWVNSL